MRAPALRAPRRPGFAPELRAASQPSGGSSTGAGASDEPPRLRVVDPGTVRLLGYEDYRRIFMPIGWEYADERRAAGDHSYLTGEARKPHDAHIARLWAGQHAVTALLRPGEAAAAAVAFYARRMAAQDQEATE